MSFLNSNTPPINGQKVPSPVGQSVMSAPSPYSPEAMQAEHRAKWLAAQEKVTAIRAKLTEHAQQQAELNSLVKANGVRITDTLETFKGEPIFQLSTLSGADLGQFRRISAKEARKYNAEANYIYIELDKTHLVTFVTELEARQYFGRMPHHGRRPQPVQLAKEVLPVWDEWAEDRNRLRAVRSSGECKRACGNDGHTTGSVLGGVK